MRKVDMLEGVSILRSEKVKDGNDIELVSRSAALINQVTFLHNLFLHMNGLESLSQHNLSCKRKYTSYEVTFSPLMSGDFRPRR